MSDVLNRAMEAAAIYLIFGGPLTAFVLACAVAALGVPAVVLKRPRLGEAARRVAAFGAILFACGMPANVVYTIVLRGRFYTDNDPLVDWLPWLPSELHTIDFACQGRYLGGASAWTLNVAWALLAVPVWVCTLWIFRKVCSIGWLSHLSPASEAAQQGDAAGKP
jgi:hypothetical protein